MQRVEIVSFDVFGTLIDLVEDKERPEAYEGLARWLGYHGIRLPGPALHEEVRQRVRQQLSTSLDSNPDVDMVPILSQAIGQLAPCHPEEVEALIREACLVLRMLTTVSLTAVPGAVEVLQTLAPEFQLGICSNTQRAYTIGELRTFGLLDWFEHIVFSSDVLAGKPSPRIFEEFARRFGTQPGQIVHVGDVLVDDVAGAAALGMRTVWIDRKHSAASSEIKPSATVLKLTDVPAAIRSLAAG